MFDFIFTEKIDEIIDKINAQGKCIALMNIEIEKLKKEVEHLKQQHTKIDPFTGEVIK